MANLNDSPGFGKPSDGGSAPTNPDDEFAGAGLPVQADEGPSPFDSPLGVFDAIVKKIKAINSANFTGLAVEFELTDPDVEGEQYALMVEYFNGDENRAQMKKKAGKYRRLAQAFSMMGVQYDPQTCVPSGGWRSLEGVPCRLAVSTYDKAGQGPTPTIVLGRPRFRKSEGREVGWSDAIVGTDGRPRDYGCGILPVSE